jgi:hypothetical protein
LERLGQGLASPVNASDVARDVGLTDNQATNARVGELAVSFLAWRCPRSIGGRPSESAQSDLGDTRAGARLGSRAALTLTRERAAMPHAR